MITKNPNTPNTKFINLDHALIPYLLNSKIKFPSIELKASSERKNKSWSQQSSPTHEKEK